MLRKLGMTAAIAVAASTTAGSAHAQISDGVIKIGVLNDQSPLAWRSKTSARQRRA
jgi:hypothetical protein